ncbi:MAG TPA: single-stranded DNA-binding protein [Candidatus Competibacteraceae bacterium]|nr:single-stranded DNA-binding protein [Candidatus Competibacteraceae bacterium]
MMQLHVSGRLVRDPAQKTSSNGKDYVHALMTASSGDGEILITVMVFDPELQTLLASLRKGDSLSAIGAASIRAYSDKEGKPNAGVTLMANRLMIMIDRQAAPSPRDNGQRRTQGHHQPAPQNLPPIEAYNDIIPF